VGGIKDNPGCIGEKRALIGNWGFRAVLTGKSPEGKKRAKRGGGGEKEKGWRAGKTRGNYN